ncbi:MAG TPA: type I 3-dehydroquinate dehydratase [Anaerovoracaceae bacterium]|nr:type I 3-dehydroquinate dehydratase [Anaerovoracaceae bacterium]
MKSIKVRELIIGEGPPKICVPLVGRSRKELLSSVSIATRLRPDIYELRADYLKDNPKEMAMIIKDVRTIITNSPLIYTLRSEEEGGQSDLPREHYLNQNLKAIESGHADIIDVELEKGEEVINKLASAAHEKNRHILLSKHYFGKMPHKIEMLKVFQIMQGYPSDIVKIAVMIDNERELLDLLDISLTMKNECKDRPFVIIGMGKNGMLSRIIGGIFGSALTFSKGSEPSAPGQLGVEEVRQVIELLDKNI